ncbi:uncharacterized protein LOC115633804 [Scaptodrosophila lebanonensis]|uniref:Uncharacterized protein LOC115633804 n=1 Tax=Drosophila lebanonensis TaxID=7225 RepID=A0A6J2UFA5_DROLE|nr:uncharacterized protein LOC115633804 [Scaptodrosophila lebanonensis]
MKELKVARAISESSTTSDNTSDFIDIVKKYDVVYNNHNPDYKNVEVKMKVWKQISDEIGLSIEASKRKWKNLRDSYTKYLRSFRVGTKTSKKYQYWAHAEHMEFLKPYQGPGRNSVNGNGKSNDEDDTECDFGYQMLSKAASNAGEEDLKSALNTVTTATGGLGNTTLNTHTVNTYTTAMTCTGTSVLTPSTVTSAIGTPPNLISPSGVCAPNNLNSHSSNSNGSSGTNCAAVAPLNALTPPVSSNSNSAVVLPLPTMSSVSLSAMGKENAAALATLANLHLDALPLPGTGTSAAAAAAAVAAQQMFPLATLKAAAAAAGMQLPPPSSTANNVGCLIIEPHLFAAADNFKKELNAAAAVAGTTPLGLFQNLANQAHGLNNLNINALGTGTNISNRLLTPSGINAAGNCNSLPLSSQSTSPMQSSKVRRVQPSPQTAAINLSCSATTANTASAVATQPPPAKTRKLSDQSRPSSDLDVGAVLQANRDLDANTLFFLSLARQVRTMPMKFQSLAKMRCMRIVSDIELELENVDCNGLPPSDEGSGAANLKYCSIDTPPPPHQDGSGLIQPPISMAPDGSTEHFVYVMSPSRVESMIDISSSDEETNMNGMPVGAGS